MKVTEPKRDLTKLPISSWGRHELVAEVRRLQETGGSCSMCRGTKVDPDVPQTTCRSCAGSGWRSMEVETLYRFLGLATRAARESKQKADSHRKKSVELQLEIEELKRLIKHE